MKSRIKLFIKVLILVFTIALLFACHKKKKPFLLLPLVDNVAINESGGGSSFTPARGELDTTFDGSGFAIIDIASGNDFGYSLAIQSDGKILLGGYCWDNDGSNKFCIARFNTNGTIDTSFGSSGKVIQDIASGDDYGESLAIQPDGKILLGGYCIDGSTKFCIARFNTDGTLDTSFGSSGKVIENIASGNDFGYSLAIQPDGKILFGGYCNDGSNKFCLARFK